MQNVQQPQSIVTRRVSQGISQDNHRSAGLLEKLGFRLDGMVSLSPGGDALKLYAAAASEV